MALPKRARDEGGSFYKGYKLVVGASPDDYQMDMILADKGCAVNGILITPDKAGTGDYFTLTHLDENGVVVKKNAGIIAETIYNMGKFVTQEFDFVSLELFDPGHKLRLTYTNVAGIAMNVYTTVERVT